jgi:hypothetical protein
LAFNLSTVGQDQNGFVGTPQTGFSLKNLKDFWLRLHKPAVIFPDNNDYPEWRGENEEKTGVSIKIH